MAKKIKILAIGDSGDNIYLLKKFSKKLDIHIITFPRAGTDLLTISHDRIEIFDSLKISKQVKKINEIKNNFDLCIVMTWSAARIAYLANLNYVMYFTGGDITTPPFVKNPTLPYLNEPAYRLNWIERSFYKKIFDNAIECIAPMDEYFGPLKKLRNNAIRMDRIFVDVDIFNQNIKALEKTKEKFVFLSAQRFGIEKGFDIIFQALDKCKTDFEVWQIEWFIEGTLEEKNSNVELLKKIPSQVKFIPVTKRDELAKLFHLADAILGQMRSGVQGGIERDAAYCKRPVICYTEKSKPMIIDNKKVIPPFLPNSLNPNELAILIDKIVESKKFRDELAEREHEYIKELSSPEKVSKDWEDIFSNLHIKYKSINHNSSKFLKKLENCMTVISEILFYNWKMKERNTKIWGKEKYTKLMK